MTLAALAVIFGTLLLIAYMLKLINDHTEQELDTHITQALDLANRWCNCADPNEVTLIHGTHYCTRKPR